MLDYKSSQIQGGCLERGVSGARKYSGGLMRHLEGDGRDLDEMALLGLLRSVFPVLSGFGSLSIRSSTRWRGGSCNIVILG